MIPKIYSKNVFLIKETCILKDEKIVTKSALQKENTLLIKSGTHNTQKNLAQANSLPNECVNHQEFDLKDSKDYQTLLTNIGNETDLKTLTSTKNKGLRKVL